MIPGLRAASGWGGGRTLNDHPLRRSVYASARFRAGEHRVAISRADGDFVRTCDGGASFFRDRSRSRVSAVKGNLECHLDELPASWERC